MAKYHLSVGSQEKDDSSESLFPTLELSHGLIDFDFDLAASVPIEEDIRARADLWTGNHPPDVAFFVLAPLNSVLLVVVVVVVVVTFVVVKALVVVVVVIVVVVGW